MGDKSKKDPFRRDAGVVYRHLRDAGPASVPDLAVSCFPVASDGPESSLKALSKRSTRRVLDSLVWMRHQGVTLTAVPDVSGAVFHLGAVAIDPERVRGVALSVFADRSDRSDRLLPVTVKVSSQKSESLGGDAMDVWHGGNR